MITIMIPRATSIEATLVLDDAASIGIKKLSNQREVTFFHYFQVVLLMTDDHKAHTQHGNFVFPVDSLALHDRVVKTGDKAIVDCLTVFNSPINSAEVR